MNSLFSGAILMNLLICRLCKICLILMFLTLLRQTKNVCLTDGADVLYNKFNVTGFSLPHNPPLHPNSDNNCAVATTGHWRVSRCNEQHLVVCQFAYDITTSMTF